ncbi:Protein c2orf25 [Diplonema papillatum]|nr:Protein c2orf25 [Diplonema papillatum]
MDGEKPRVSKKQRNTLIPPTTIKTRDSELEYSLHKVTASLVPDLQPCLPEVPKNRVVDLLIMPTFQKTSCPVIEFTAESAAEKDRLLDAFVAFAGKMVEKVQAAGHWADYLDPCTGYGRVRGPSPYSEVGAAEAILPYSVVHVGTLGGGCRMVSHPKWDLSCYPATMFFLCPLETVTAALAALQEEESAFLAAQNVAGDATAPGEAT